MKLIVSWSQNFDWNVQNIWTTRRRLQFLWTPPEVSDTQLSFTNIIQISSNHNTHTHTHTSITRDTTDMVDDPDNMPESQFRFWWYERIVAYNLIHLDLNCKLWEMPLKKPPKESAAKEYITVSVLTEMLKQQKVFFKDPRNKTSKRFYNYSWRQQTSESMTL